eukprot:PITA_20086
MLEEKHKTIFWTPCAAHCIDLILEDIGKLGWVKNTVDHAKSITKFIYNHSWILSLMRKHTGGRDIIRPAITRFATHFLTLQFMLSQHRNLQKIFSSEEWNQSQWSHKLEGKELKNKVNEEIFWRKAIEIVKLVEPLVKVLWLVDGERLAMGFIYEAMDQAKEQIKRAYKDKVAKYGPIWYNLWLRRNQLLNKRLDLNPIVLEDIDPTSYWAVESHPAEFYFDEDLDLDLQGEASLEHDVQLNADPNPLVPASASQLASPPIAGASSAQPRQKRNDISRLSQLTSVAQPVSATTSTVAVGDDDDEEPWGPLSDSNDDLEIDPHDLGSSSSSY